MKVKTAAAVQAGTVILAALLFLVLNRILWSSVPERAVRMEILAVCGGFLLLEFFRVWFSERQIRGFADEICGTLDALAAGREEALTPSYEDTLTARIRGKLAQYHEIMSAGCRESRKDKETIQGLVSDISHQVKTPVANLKMFAGILKKHDLPEEKRREFLDTMEGQVDKLDFLMQSLIRMSRLETGTFVLHPSEAPLSATIAAAMSTVWSKAEKKNIALQADCDPSIIVRHDPKWTAEAVGNILDNAVKYTPEGGSVSVSVRPWQFYTKIDITDTGMGIAAEHYHDVFRRFYRAEEAASMEGVGLGLYLANGIINRQKGYISVRSEPGKGTTFSVYLLS